MVREHVVPAPKDRHVKLVLIRAPGEFEDVADVGHGSEDVAVVDESALHVFVPDFRQVVVALWRSNRRTGGFVVLYRARREVIARVPVRAAYGFQLVGNHLVFAGLVLIIEGILAFDVKGHIDFCDFAGVGTWTAWDALVVNVEAVRLRVAATHPAAIAGRASPGASQTCICIWKAITRTPGRTVHRTEGRAALPGATNEQLVRVGQRGRVLPKRREGASEAGRAAGRAMRGRVGQPRCKQCAQGQVRPDVGGQGASGERT